MARSRARSNQELVREGRNTDAGGAAGPEDQRETPIKLGRQAIGTLRSVVTSATGRPRDRS
jgi:hypothetical protein